MKKQTENEKLAEAFAYGWQSAIECLQSVYKKGVDPLAQIIILDYFEKKIKKPTKNKGGEQ